MDQYRQLSPFPESLDVLRALKSRPIVTGILSNGDPQMLGAAVRNAGMDRLLDHVLSVDAIRKYKTHPAAYTMGTEATGLDAGRILFVSSNAWDALAATWFGYMTLWINRHQLPFEELGVQPTARGATLEDVLAFLEPGS